MIHQQTLLFDERFGIDIERSNREIVFVGDSPNDAPMFEYFQNSVGVANVRRFEGSMAASPRYVTRAAAGAGFVELAEHLLVGTGGPFAVDARLR